MSDDTGWTRMPNAILDDMEQLGNAELRVYLALVRRITGFNKDTDVISLSQLEKQTGLGRQHVHAALNELLTRNYISREPAKRGSFSYQLVTLGNQLPKRTSYPREPVPVTLGNQSLVTLGNTQNKEKEISKEKGTAPRKRGSSSHPRDIVFETVATVCGIDWSVCTEAQRHQLNQTTATLRRSAEKQQVDESGTLDRIRHTERYWYRVDWRGKQQQPPTPAQLREVWGAAMKTYHARAPASVAPGEPEPTPADVAAYLRSKRNGSTPTPE